MNHSFEKMTGFFNLISMNVTHIYHCTVGSEWNFNNHSAKFSRMYFILDGKGRIFNDKEDVELIPNNVYIIPSDGCYSYRCEEYMEKIFLHFTVSIIPHKDLMSNLDGIAVFGIGEEKMRQIKELFYNGDIKSSFACQLYIRDLVYSALSGCGSEINEDFILYGKYGRMYQYINDNLFADTSVKSVCDYMGFSQTYIGQRFKRDTGTTIKEYMSELLVGRIKYLLQCTNMAINEISDELHFNSEFYCSKFFKRRTGITPTEYRRRHTELPFVSGN